MSRIPNDRAGKGASSTANASAGAPARRAYAFSFQALGRALGYMFDQYRLQFIVVVACVVVSAIVTAYSVLFSQTLVDDYITPMLATGSTDFSGLAGDLLGLGAVLAVGAAASLGYNKLMVYISQGTMRNLRNELFEHMESLPIRYFDTHAHGDIMSVYTNDVDTLRQLYDQTVPQVVNSAHHADKPADDLRDHGGRRIRAHLRVAGREARGGPRLRGAGMRPHVAGRQRGAVRGAHRPLGLEAPAPRRHRDLRAPEGRLELDHVDFGYTPEKCVLHDISLAAKPGQKVAFVGSTGAGKTTITNLINRFYDIDDGKIRYDGINVNKIKKEDLRRSLGIVLQDTHLFTGTVMDNIRYGRLDATDEECVAAAKLAGADGFIRRLPNGYQTVISGDGASLSQGQCQLLAIARAAVADPPALILDEATSSIDTRTEEIVQRGMDALMAWRTTFVIAHRLSTVKNADLICVMEQGRIIERGSHDKLMAQRGRYWQLYTGGLEE